MNPVGDFLCYYCTVHGVFATRTKEMYILRRLYSRSFLDSDRTQCSLFPSSYYSLYIIVNQNNMFYLYCIVGWSDLAIFEKGHCRSDTFLWVEFQKICEFGCASVILQIQYCTFSNYFKEQSPKRTFVIKNG